jgi:hypothetical protein
MKFFIRYLLRLETKHIAPPLITGTAFHEGKAIWYNTRSEKKAVNKVAKVIEQHEEDYEKAEFFDRDLIRFPLLLEVWIEKFGRRDIKNFELVAVEKELKVTVPHTNGFVMTMRPDLVYRDKSDDRLYVMDTKTSSFSKKITDMGLYYGDQATSYLWAVEDKFKEKPVALIGDVAYWNKSARDEGNIDCYRTDLVMRSDTQVEEFQYGVGGLFNEISQKVSAWKTGNYNKAQLFPRNTYYCNSFAKPCEYSEICRTNIEEKKRAPVGFVRVPNSKTKTLNTCTLDEITES